MPPSCVRNVSLATSSVRTDVLTLPSTVSLRPRREVSTASTIAWWRPSMSASAPAMLPSTLCRSDVESPSIASEKLCWRSTSDRTEAATLPSTTVLMLAAE